MLHLDLVALDIVVSNPVLGVVGIRHVLDGIPGLSGSFIDEVTDLK